MIRLIIGQTIFQRKKDKGDPRSKFQKIAKSYESDKKKKPIEKTNGRSEQNAQACTDFINSMMQEADFEK